MKWPNALTRLFGGKQQPEIQNAVISSDNAGMAEMFDLGSAATAGEVVNESTALRVSAVYAAVSLVAGAVASMPLHLYRRTATGREKQDNPPLWWLLNEQPHPDLSAATFWETMLTARLLQGDAIAEVQRDRNGRPLAFVPLNPAHVLIDKWRGGLIYTWHDGEKLVTREAGDMLHVPGLGWDGKRSMSPIRWAAANSVGMALAADKYNAAFFANGARPDFVLETDGKLSDDAVKVLRNTWSDMHQGAGRAHKPAVLTGGLKAKAISLSAPDAQLLETRRFSVEEIARIFGVPPHLIGHTDKTTSWGSGIESMMIGFVQFTLSRHLNAIEQEINRKLFRTAANFVEFAVEGLLRGDTKARSDFYKSALGGSAGPAWMTVNEVRRIENLPPIEGGDQLIKWERSNVKVPAGSADGEPNSAA